MLRIRGHALPDGEWIDLYADGDRWTQDPVPGADLVAERWLLPGLVVYDSDPCADLRQLDHPRAVILRGRLRYRR